MFFVLLSCKVENLNFHLHQALYLNPILEPKEPWENASKLNIHLAQRKARIS